MNHNQDPTGQQSLKLPFMQEFDGSQPEVSPEEMTQVSEDFRSFADDLLLANFDQVDSGDRAPVIRQPLNRLDMIIPGQAGGHWNVVIVRPQERDALGRSFSNNDFRSISLYYYDANQNQRIGAQYGPIDGEICRTDLPDIWAEDQANEQMRQAGIDVENRLDDPLGLTGEERRAAFQAIYDQVDNSPEVDALESDMVEMGFNEQPIGSAELEGLKRFLTSPDVQVVAPAA